VAVVAACGGPEKLDPPPTPANVAATPGDGVVGVRWDAAAGADGYTVYWSTASGVGKTGGTAIHAQATSLNHTGLTNGVTYYYVVTAVNGGGESPESPEASATPLPAHYPLTISTDGSGGGTVASAPAGIDCGATCAASFATASSVTLTATPDAISTFAGWAGDCSGAGDCTVTMDGARSVTATFTRITHHLAVVRAGTGGGTVASTPAGIDCGATCDATYDAGTSVTLTATPDATSTFAGWSGACTGTGDCTVTVDAAASVTATFTRITHSLAVSRAGTGGGTVTSSPAGIDCGTTCAASYEVGTVVALIAIPDATSTFAGWSGACTGMGACTVTVDAASSVTATFTRITYPLTVARAGTGGGAVTSSPVGIDCGATCSATYEMGTVVALIATPDATSTFAGWSGACVGTGACVMTMDAAKSVTATFTRLTRVLTVTRAGTGAGAVTSSPAGVDCGVTCAATYEMGTVVALSATPDATSIFAGWSGACVGTGACLVTMDAVKSVTATFTRITYQLSVSLAGPGSGTVDSAPAGIACGATCSASYDAGTVVTLTATPSATSTFAGWSGACTNASGPCTVTMSLARSVTATFAPVIYGLSVTRTGGGAVTSSPSGISCGATCSAGYAAGTVVSLTATPDATATFAGWTGACSGTSPTCTVTMDAAKAVGARFTFPLTITKAGTGSGTVNSSPSGISCGPTCSASFDTGTSVTLVATPDSVSDFTGWSGAGCSGTASCTVTVDAVKTVSATFMRRTHALDVSIAGSGFVQSSPAGINCSSGTCSAVYGEGTVVTLTANASGTFLGWSGACSGTGSTCTVTMNAAKTVGATFSNRLSVSKSGTGGGTVTSSPAGIDCGSTCSAWFAPGTAVTLTPTPDASSLFSGWSGSCSGTGICTVTMNGFPSVTATFTP
jgi:uncharacterized repeat protein (TIGR02543 family)